MPDDVQDRMFFSFDIGNIHFISINTEYYYFLDQYGTTGADAQFDWLVQDLKVPEIILVASNNLLIDFITAQFSGFLQNCVT